LNYKKFAKLKLYSILHKIDPDELTEIEINIMYELSRDHEIQEVFNKAME